MKGSKNLCGAVRQFSLFFAKGTIGYPLLKDVDLYQAKDFFAGEYQT